MPSSAVLYFIAGAAALELRQTPSAIEYLSRAVNLDPARADYLVQLSRALTAVRRYADASVVAGKAWALLPRDPIALDMLGVVFSRLNEHIKAVEVFQRLVDSNPQSAGYRFNLATSLIFTGSIAAAEVQLEECLKLDPGFWKAYPALAKLRKQTDDRNHVERLLAVLPDAQGPDAATYVHMALSKEFEDLGQYPDAFEHLVLGKTPLRIAKGYLISRDEAMFEAIERNFGGAVPSTSGHPSSEPIFVFGMPRSGTTLVERILSSHSHVQSMGELENFGFVLKRASGSATSSMLDPDTIMRSRRLDWAGLGGDYLASTRPGTGKKPRFVDKLPQNFLYAGDIANALPMARMICVRRHPMDTCLGNFRQLFALASPYYDYSLDILDTGRYYMLFDRLMAYWERMLPGRILTVEYEALVHDQERWTQRLLEFCGLPWEEACLRFNDNAAPVATASALQVREPMNSNSIGRWKNYRPQLAPLRRMLEDAGIEIRD
ncbi:sulfotransferase [Pseudoluteimonas lycopersici]|uniref:Sulfotransferase n=2 Tax=Pseudoluteimonas lycopersici TaxID=1324796 RepID=A0A516V888_9GAMM|nr:sulfotransferase [Lysobacter lycopersici]